MIATRCRVMGILNVTPDSFSDGGAYLAAEAAIAHATQMLADGADIIDVGGESTRPGAHDVGADEEIGRVLPVIEAILRAHPDATVSIDTMKASVAAAALDAGARIVNDVSAGRDPAMLPLVAERSATVCLMHMLGEPRTMQRDPRYRDVVAEVRDMLRDRMGAAMDAGVPRERIIIDPGIGFGKTREHNLLLLRHLAAFTDLGADVMVGASRKSFIGTTLDAEVGQRLEGSLAIAVWAAIQGAALVRVHDVRATIRALRMLDAVRDA
jgi:dihydropteroate synthase